jgi:hypothetical protein
MRATRTGAGDSDSSQHAGTTAGIFAEEGMVNPHESWSAA